MKVSVSVIIPFYNGISWLIEAVESVLTQTYASKEIIVVNDGSKEDINKFLNRYKNRIIYIYKENGGSATARNIGIEKSTGDYIAFLDSDDLWQPSKLEKQIAIMEKTHCIWSHTGYETFDTKKDEPNTIKKISVANFDGNIYPKILMSNNLATPCIIIKGDFLRKNSSLRFNNEMRHGEDQFLWINIALKHNIVAIDEVLTRVRIRGSNVALCARIQLQVRANIWQILKQDKNKFRVKEIPGFTRFAYKLSSLSYKILATKEESIKNNLGFEILSRIMYVIPWMLFKLDYRRNIGN